MRHAKTYRPIADIARILNARGLFQLARDIAESHNVLVYDVLGHSRLATHTKARHALMRALRAEPYSFSYPEIGKLLDRDHTSVMYAIHGRVRTGPRLVRTRIAVDAAPRAVGAAE